MVYNRRGHARMSVLPSMTSLATAAAGMATGSQGNDGSISSRTQKHDGCLSSGEAAVGNTGGRGLTLNQSRKETVALQGETAAAYVGGRGEEVLYDLGRTASEENSASGGEDVGGYLARAATPDDLDLSIAVTTAAQVAATQSAASVAAASGGGAVAEATVTVVGGASSTGGPGSVATAKATVKVAKIFPKHSDIADMEEVSPQPHKGDLHRWPVWPCQNTCP